jgi:hypothetical protein
MQGTSPKSCPCFPVRGASEFEEFR